MNQLSSPLLSTTSIDFLSGGGELGQRIREFDWEKTPLGPVDNWPRSLRTCVRIMLSSRQPIWIGWGRDLIKLYNDPYKAIVGGKHPWALGQPASVVWKDIWHDIEPMLKTVMENDEGTYVESQLLIMERNGYPEETYYTFSYTPIPGDDGGTAGMICANTDDTDRIISERQLRTLTHLGQRLTDCRTNEEIIEKTISTLKENPYDFPFAIFRTIEGRFAKLSGHTEFGESLSYVPQSVNLDKPSPIAECINLALEDRKPRLFEGLTEQFGPIPSGAWKVPPEKAIVLPILQSTSREPYGVLVVGVNPYRLLDEKYLGFFSLVADQVATSFADVHAFEEERKRAEALAEIDRAKTIFFSNISHEFRTPLSLLLGPIEDALNDPASIEENRVRMDVAFRNGLRMQKLVNTLLDFSRIEAGRLEGKFSRVDIASLTQDLVSTFRSAVEKAGMQLITDLPPIHEEIYVDPDMWEKIVLNLVSNAFKYTREGSIRVSLRSGIGKLQLEVADTGVGIPTDQLHKVFERFHRIENAHGRSLEGTGIGLALVKELVKLHQGTIDVESQVGRGSVFTVTIPTGYRHLPEDRIFDGQQETSNFNYANAFAQEALKWLPQGLDGDPKGLSSGEDAATHKRKYTVVLADDNADMRAYVERLLSQHYKVLACTDGQQAYDTLLREEADLLVSDVMMPGLDGFELLQQVRAHPQLKSLPVIFLSARAGDEAKVEGLDAGADDYIVKPFSAKEMLARVDANIKISKTRIATEKSLRSVIQQAPVAMALLRGPELTIDIANEFALEIWGKKLQEVINRPLLQAMPELEGQEILDVLRNVYHTGNSFRGNEFPVVLVRRGVPETRYINFIYETLRDVEEPERIEGVFAIGVDVTEQVMARKKIELSERELQEMATAMPQLVWVADPSGRVYYYNDRIAELSGVTRDADGFWNWSGMIHPNDIEETQGLWKEAAETGRIYQAEHRLKMKDGSFRWHLSRGIPHKDEDGNIIKWFGTATDIHVSKEYASVLEEEVKRRTRELHALNHSLKQSNDELEQFAHVASHDLQEPLRKIRTFLSRLEYDPENKISQQSTNFITKIHSAANRMKMMIEGVLNYSMVNAVEQSSERVDLNHILKQIETDLEVIIAGKQATIISDDLPVLEGASILYYQLFYNLVNNSLKFTRPDEPPVIRIAARNYTEQDKPFCEIIVSDNGIGFKQAFADHIFDSFARLHSRDRYEGTGIGLSLCKRIVERHHGSIEARGVENEGATFIMHFPLEPGAVLKGTYEDSTAN